MIGGRSIGASLPLASTLFPPPQGCSGCSAEPIETTQGGDKSPTAAQWSPAVRIAAPKALLTLPDSAARSHSPYSCRYFVLSEQFFILHCRLVTQDLSNTITTVCFSLYGTMERGSELSCNVLTWVNVECLEAARTDGVSRIRARPASGAKMTLGLSV